MKAFLLGLSNGAVCLAYCAPVLVPCLLGGNRGIAANSFMLLRFLSGRLLGYILFGILAWMIGKPLIDATGFREPIIGSAYLMLALLLIRFGFSKASSNCAASRLAPLANKFASFPRVFMPELLGFATGLNFCPPFLLALTEAASKETMLQSLFFFIAFFMGTTLFFIPLPFIGLLGKYPALKTIGKMTAVIMGIYYLYSGAIMIAGRWIAP